MVVAIEIWILYDKDLFMSFLNERLKHAKIEYLQSDNLHHKFNVTAIYPIDLVQLGMLIEKFYNNNK